MKNLISSAIVVQDDKTVSTSTPSSLPLTTKIDGALPFEAEASSGDVENELAQYSPTSPGFSKSGGFRDFRFFYQLPSGELIMIKHKAILVNEVTYLRKAMAPVIYPNGDIILLGKKYTFAPFLSHDVLHCDGSQDSKCERKLLLDSLHATPDRTTSPDNDGLASPDRNTDALLQESEVITTPVRAVVPSSSLRTFRWKPEDADAPQVPGCYTNVAESKFEIQVEEFFNHFFSDAAVNFVDSFHKRCGDKDFRCSVWFEDQTTVRGRDVSFRHPIKLYMGTKFAHCNEQQEFRVYRNSHLVIKTLQKFVGVPDEDCFCVQGLWDVQKAGNETNSCVVRVYVDVEFSKETLWKGEIKSNTISECKDAYALWMQNAHELLKQKAPSELESGVSSAGFAMRNDEVPSETVATNTKDLRNPSRASSTTSFLRKLLARLCLYMKSQIRLPLILAIVSILIGFLMLLWIISLLARPPQVHVTSQVDYMNSFGNSAGDQAEAVVWLEMQIHHLKDEILMIESHVEKMRRGH